MADIPLGPPGGVLVYGTKGPDKWTFIQDGILDRKHDGTDHRFTIDGREVDLVISAGRPLPYWQCPPHPDIDPQRYCYEWSDAWEIEGCGGDGQNFVGIYSLKSRKGVFHFWPLKLKDESCPDARQDMWQFFTAKQNSTSLLALKRAMDHMVRGSAVGGYHVDCEKCWQLFRRLRRTCDLRPLE
jgi:hypothetical protein